MKLWEMFALAGLLLVAAISSGCAESSAAGDAADIDGSKFMLAEEPADVMCVMDVREQMPIAGEVSVLGRIGGIQNPWTTGEASFVMSDPSLIAVAEDDHECGDNCPYCKEKKKEQISSMAFVQIVDEDGHVVPLDAQKLLPLSADQMVVVRGKVGLNRGGHLVIAARGIYVRQ